MGAWLVGAYLWLFPAASPPPRPAESTPDAAGTATQKVVAAPPIDGPPSPAALDLAIDRAVRAFREIYVLPSLEAAASGGYLEVMQPGGGTERMGPDVYAQCQLYLLVHALMYADEFGFSPDDPMVVAVDRWMMDSFDPETGSWLWSDEGCLHPKSLIALALRGHDAAFREGWQWALQSRIYLPDQNLFSIGQSGRIIQTLGLAERSLSGEFYWEHASPLPDEENSAKFLYALLASGRSPDDPEVRRLQQAIAGLIAGNPLRLGFMQTHHLLGRAWWVLLHLRFRLAPDPAYPISLAVLRAAIAGGWEQNYAMRAIPLFRAIALRALLEAGDRGPEIDAMIHGFVDAQDEDGAWHLPHTYAVWNLHQPPRKGYKYGDMDGANTYMTTLALLSYRRRGMP